MILESFRLEGRAALVTGAARGMGLAIALGLAEAGADIVALDRDSLSDCCREVESRGRRALGLAQDLSGLTPERAAAIIGECLARFGRLDILINNAGIIRRALALEYSSQDWEDVLGINLSAPFYLAQAFARQCVAVEQGGRIVNVASLLSFQGGILVPSYAAAKSGLAGLTRALANEWAEQGINVNAIAPGYIATEVTAGIRSDPERNQAVLARIPAGRWGEPDDVQGAVVFLCSDAARYVHGTILPVDGGWLAR